MVLAGNSAGWQFVQRYAALSAVEDRVNAGGARVRFTYVAANPSSYLYFDATRADASGRMRIPAPADAARCPDYNSYGYGLENPNAYAGRTGAATVRRGSSAGPSSISSATTTTTMTIPASTATARPKCRARSGSNGPATTGTT